MVKSTAGPAPQRDSTCSTPAPTSTTCTAAADGEYVSIGLDRAAVLRRAAAHHRPHRRPGLRRREPVRLVGLGQAEGAAHRGVRRRRPATSGARSMEHTDVCFAPVLTMNEAMQHPHNVGPRHVRRVRRPSAAGARHRASRARPARSRAPPALNGEHTARCWPSWASTPTSSTRCRASAPCRSGRESAPPAQSGAASLTSPDRTSAPWRRSLFFHAHPDDEAITTGGPDRRAAAEGHRARRGDSHRRRPRGDARRPRRRRDARRPPPRDARSSLAAGARGPPPGRLRAMPTPGCTGWSRTPRRLVPRRPTRPRPAERLAAVLREERPTSSSPTTGTATTATRSHHGPRRRLPGRRSWPARRRSSRAPWQPRRDCAVRASLRPTTPGRPRRGEDFDPRRPDGRRQLRWASRKPRSACGSTCRATSSRRNAQMRHRSQVTDTSFFAQMPDEGVYRSFGTEWFKRRGVAEAAGRRLAWYRRGRVRCMVRHGGSRWQWDDRPRPAARRHRPHARPPQ